MVGFSRGSSIIAEAAKIVKSSFEEDIALGVIRSNFSKATVVPYEKFTKAAQQIVNSNPDQFTVFAREVHGGVFVQLAKPLDTSSLTKSSLIRPTLMADVEWFNQMPCVVEINQCGYISGTPMYFLSPSSVLFGPRNGNEEGDHVGEVNKLLQKYYEKGDWAALECKPGVPCVARNLDVDEYSYVRAIVVDSVGDGMFQCICIDIAARIKIDACDIGPLPDFFSTERLKSLLFVGRIRGVNNMTIEDQDNLRKLFNTYFTGEEEVAEPLAAAVFGRIGNECVVDWVHPDSNEWISKVLLEQRMASPFGDDLPDPQVDHAYEWMKKMEDENEFKFKGLEWSANNDGPTSDIDRVNKAAGLVAKQPEADDRRSIASEPDEDAPLDIDVEDVCETVKRVNIEDIDLKNSENVKKEIHQASAISNNQEVRTSNSPANFLEIFKNVHQADRSDLNCAFVASSLAFAAYAKVLAPSECWDAVIAEVRKQL